MNVQTTNTNLLDFLKWRANDSGCENDKNIVANVEYRLLCSGVLKPAHVTGDWMRSDGARLLLSAPIFLAVVSEKIDDYPQELALRFPYCWGTSSDTTIAADLAALLTLFTRRLVTVHSKTRTVFHPETTPNWAGLDKWMHDWPNPILNAKTVGWNARSASVITERNGMEIQFHDPAPKDIDGEWIRDSMRHIATWKHADALRRSARLYASAMAQIESQPEASYQLFISATETIAGATLKGWTPPDEEIIKSKGSLLKIYQSLGIEDAVAQKAVLASATDNPWSKRKFVKFLIESCDWQSLQLRDDLFMVPDTLLPKSNNTEKVLKRIYDHRSGATHSGHVYPASAQVGSSPLIPLDAVGDVLAGNEPFPPIGWFERVVNNAILNVIRGSMRSTRSD